MEVIPQTCMLLVMNAALSPWPLSLVCAQVQTKQPLPALAEDDAVENPTKSLENPGHVPGVALPARAWHHGGCYLAGRGFGCSPSPSLPQPSLRLCCIPLGGVTATRGSLLTCASCACPTLGCPKSTNLAAGRGGSPPAPSWGLLPAWVHPWERAARANPSAGRAAWHCGPLRDSCGTFHPQAWALCWPASSCRRGRAPRPRWPCSSPARAARSPAATSSSSAPATASPSSRRGSRQVGASRRLSRGAAGGQKLPGVKRPVKSPKYPPRGTRTGVRCLQVQLWLSGCARAAPAARAPLRPGAGGSLLVPFPGKYLADN